MKKQIICSVDVGRSQVKVVSDKVRFSFPTVITGVEQDQSLVQFDSDEFPAQIQVDKKSYYLGDTALLRSSFSCFNLGESEPFHQASLVFILYSVARSVYLQRLGDQVILAINLTFLNSQFNERYAKALKGKQSVILYPNGKPTEVKFEITRLFSFYQGYVSVFNFYGKKPDVSKSTCLCVDVGCYTTDVSLVKNFTLVSGRSFNIGSSRVIEKLTTQLSRQGVTLDFFAIDKAICSGSGKVKSLTGTQVDIVTEFNKLFVNEVGSSLYPLITNFIGNQPIEYVILCGGVSTLLELGFKSLVKVPILKVVDPTYANSTGMNMFLHYLIG